MFIGGKGANAPMRLVPAGQSLDVLVRSNTIAASEQ